MDFLSNNQTQLFIAMGLIAYIALAKPSLPSWLKDLVSNSYFKIALLAFIAWRANNNPMMSILLAVAFVITLNCATSGSVMETFAVTQKLFLNREGYVRRMVGLSESGLELDKAYRILVPYANHLTKGAGFNGSYGLIAIDKNTKQMTEIPIRYTWIQKDRDGNQLLFTNGGTFPLNNFKIISERLPGVSNSNNNQSSGLQKSGYDHFEFFVRKTGYRRYQIITKVVNKNGVSHDGKHNEIEVDIDFGARTHNIIPFFRLDNGSNNFTRASIWQGQTGNIVSLPAQ
jgi:hypothetical protein